MRSVLAVLLALVLGLLVASPALQVDFLTDDYYLGAAIHDVKVEDASVLSQVRAAFTRDWTPEFQVFRPLTILTVQLDHMLHGIDGGRHHLTNLLLWLLLAVLFQDLVVRFGGRGDALSRGLSTLAFACYPAAVEALGWLVAREDLLMAVFGCLAVWFLLRCPRSTWPATLALIPAFLAKETAVTLPPLLLALDLLVVRGRRAPDSGTGALRRLLLRHLPPFALIALYLGVRYALFGSFGTTYNQQSFGSYLSGEGALSRITANLGESAGRMIAPLSEAAREETLTAIPWWVFAALLVVPPLLFLVFGHGRQLARRLPLLLACSAWIAGPILLLAPIHHVGADLQVSRMLALPVVGYLIAVVIGWHDWRRQSPRVATLLGLVWILASAGALCVNLGSFRRASDRALRLRADLAEPFDGDRILALRVGVPGQPGVLRPELMTREGVHVLSAGLFSALRPPYRETALALHLVERDAEAALATKPPDPRPAVVGLGFLGDEPRFRRLAPGGGADIDAVLTPATGERLADSEPLTFRVTLPSTTAARVSGLTFVWTEPGGGRLETSLDDAALAGRDEGSRRHFEAILPAPLAFLRTLDAEILFWWIELEYRDDEKVRLAYETVILPK